VVSQHDSLSEIEVDREMPPHHARATTPIDVHVGLMVKMRRVERGLSQEKVASQLGITAQQLKKYERGANRIGASRLHQIAIVLDVPIQYFFRELKNGAANGKDPEERCQDNAMVDALEDPSTVRLLRLFASVRDPQLKSRVISLVEAVIVRN